MATNTYPGQPKAILQRQVVKFRRLTVACAVAYAGMSVGVGAAVMNGDRAIAKLSYFVGIPLAIAGTRCFLEWRDARRRLRGLEQRADTELVP